MTVDTRFIAFLVWGVGTVIVYGIVLVDRVRRWHHWRDARSARALMTAIGLFLTALCASLAIGFALFGESGSGIRGLLTAVSLGAYFATGVIMASTRHNREARDSD